MNSISACCSLNSKAVYTRLIQGVSYDQKAYARWCHIVIINESDWPFYCDAPFRNSKDSRLRWFQYSIVHRIIPTNKFLYMIKVTTCDKCDLCHECTESIEHLFYNCPHSSKLWHNLLICLSNGGFQGITLDIFTVLFGSNFCRELNLIIILVKYFIWKCKLQKTLPDEFRLLIFLKDYFLIQRDILLRNMKSHDS